jgi:hypothetical protein
MHAAAAPSEPSAPGAEARRSFQVHAWPLSLRLVALLAQAVHAVNLLDVAGLILRSMIEGDVNVPPTYYALRIALLSLLPLGLARGLRRACRATVDVGADGLVLQRRRVRFEIPASALAAVRPWRLPLPVPALSLRMQSGRAFEYGLESEDPEALLAALGGHGLPAAPAAQHPVTRYAQARSLVRRRGYHLALKYGLFPLIPTVIFFRLDQVITYGGPFGEYQSLGLASYVRSFLVSWASVTAYLMLYAGLWRGLVGVLAFAGAWVRPTWARGVRRFGEWMGTLAYYVGLPVLVALRFFL